MKYDALLLHIDALHQQTAGRAAAAVNQALVLRNWLIGMNLVEFEQAGEDRARYGTRLLPRLSEDLQTRGVTGVSRQQLDRCRNFYRHYAHLITEIRSTVSSMLPGVTLSAVLPSHPPWGCAPPVLVAPE